MDWGNVLRLVAPEELLSLSGLALLVIAAWGGDKSSRLITWLAVLAIAVAGYLVYPVLANGVSGSDSVVFYGQMRLDAFASFAKLLIYISAIAALLVAPAFFERVQAMRGEYPVLVLFATLGMGIMVSASDLLSLYIGLEMNSLAAYVLAAFLRSEDRSAEAGLKYFVLGALASGILLFGMSLIYGFAGTTSFDGIRLALGGGMSTGMVIAVTFMLAGLAFKISAVPFHMWTPDVYEGAPTPVTMFFASAPKVAAMALTMRVALDAFGSQVHAWQQIIVFTSLASIIVGALGAIAQTNIKRLLAYSSINNVGFILVGLATATEAGAAAMLFYLAIYVFTTIASFVAVLMLVDADGAPVEEISDLAGISQSRPGLAASLAIVMFSLAGIPPLFGFWGKFLVFMAAVKAGLMPLAVIGIAASVIGAFYYIKVVKVIYFDEPANKVEREVNRTHQVLLGVSCLVISPLGYLGTKWLGAMAALAAAALFHAG